jgi:hypothetical protein
VFAFGATQGGTADSRRHGHQGENLRENGSDDTVAAINPRNASGQRHK